MGNGAKIWASVVGAICLYFGCNRKLIMKNVYYVPEMKKNLVSISQLIQDGFCVYFHSGVDINRN